MKIVLIFLFMNLSVHAVSRFDFVLKEIIKFQEFRQEFHENYKEKLKENKTTLLQLDNDDKRTLIKRIDITIDLLHNF